MTKIKIPMSLIDDDPNIFNLTINAIAKGAKPYYEMDSVIYPIESQRLVLDTAKYVTSKGGEITEYPLFIEIDSPSADCPLALSGSWADCILPNHEIMNRDGGYYVGTNCMDGTDLTLSQLSSVWDDLLTPNHIPTPDDEQ